jgi:prephenate dehydratase
VGSKKNQNVIEALEEVQGITSDFRLMGCYNEKQAL